jgi:CelD/BcsL family acetyltransferase involved in cellulose biosynthesis
VASKKILTAPLITIVRSAQEMAALHPVWQSLCVSDCITIFQDFHWNLLALTMFGTREEPFVVCARASHGQAIVPAVVRRRDSTLRLLGEELFDYRQFLHQGEQEALSAALGVLAQRGLPLEVTALRDGDPLVSKGLGRSSGHGGLRPLPFSAAPGVLRKDVSQEKFAGDHGRLARNLRRLERLGLELRSYDGSHSALLRSIYHRKAAQDPGSLFHDPARVEFLVNAALFHPRRFEIFTLENGPRLGAALVTLRDGLVRRFYTVWFQPELHKHSPALSLVYEVTRLSLAAGLDCDYMTGEQPYKLRLATTSVPLYRLHVTTEELRGLSAPALPETQQAA